MNKALFAISVTLLSACTSVNSTYTNDPQLVGRPMALITHPYPDGQPRVPSNEAPLTFTIVDSAGKYTIEARDNKNCWKIDGDAAIDSPSSRITFSNLTFNRSFTCSNSVDNNVQEYAFDLLKSVRQYQVAESTRKVQFKDQGGRSVLWFEFVADAVQRR